MADGPDKESKTEEPTEKKLRDTVEKGKLPQSKEMALLASFAAILIFTVFMARDSITGLGTFLSTFLERPEAWPLASERDVEGLLRVVSVQIAKMLSGILILLMLAGIGASVLQHLPQFVGERIRPQASRISPAAGWKRLFGAQGWAEFLKSVAKLGLVFAVLAFVLSGSHRLLIAGMVTQPVAFSEVMRDLLIQVVLSIALIMALIAAVDLVWQRFHWRTDLRMTRQEVKDEHKQSEGDPIVKSRLRSLARDRSRRRMMAAVPRATLVIANPTHYSIALRYVREEDAAPVVLAKGQDLVALKIRALAEENGIPVFEDVALARSMYKQVSVDSVIPSQFYQAVAELVRVVYARNNPRRASS